MTTSIAILKILSAYPEGRASFASLKADLAILATSEWVARMRDLGRHAGTVNLFSSRLAVRDASGWAITAAGREFLDRLDDGFAFAPPSERPELRVVVSNPIVEKPMAPNPVGLKVVA